jgi:hypothetical protein
MIQSQIVLHRFEAVMRRVGWVDFRCGPYGTVVPHALAGPSPRLKRYASALRFPMGL